MTLDEFQRAVFAAVLYFNRDVKPSREDTHTGNVPARF